jgi:hypothetical protein
MSENPGDHVRLPAIAHVNHAVSSEQYPQAPFLVRMVASDCLLVFTQQVEKLADLLLHADMTNLAGLESH